MSGILIITSLGFIIEVYVFPLSYGDAVMELDSGVGLIMDKLRTLGIDNNTFVFFSSDNGAATYAFTEGERLLFSIVINC